MKQLAKLLNHAFKERKTNKSKRTTLTSQCISTLMLLLTINITSYAKDPREIVIIQPFPYAKDKAIAQNIKVELNLEEDIPQYISTYFKKKKSFSNISIAQSLKEKEADLYVEGEIVDVRTGNAGARYIGGFTGAGKSRVTLAIKIYDENRKLITQGKVSQTGSSGFGSFSKTFSNRANITSASKVIARRVETLIINGNTATPEGVIKAINSYQPEALRAAAKSAHTEHYYDEERVTDAMSNALQTMLDSSEKIKDKALTDGLAWCAINLGSSKNSKYKPILEAVVASKVSRKIKKRAKKSLSQLNKLESTG